ncbi:MAG: Mu transposase C-terminal domain-containing protein [Chloroflexota bacterium]|nr:Mu transposase C-terminal domain-containing protein [Chloroflexota bacterium]
MWVGGLGDQLVCDNASEHLPQAITEGCVRLGVLMSPTMPYSPWQNGKAERVLGLLNQQVCARLPGTTRGGTAPNGLRRFAPHARDLVLREAPVVSLDVLVQLVEAWRRERNLTATLNRLGGWTPVQAWAADPTPLQEIEPEVLRQAMLRYDGRPLTINGDGVHFRNRVYLAAGMVGRRGHKVRIRYLDQNRSFVEVYDLDGNHLFRAHDRDRMPQEEANAFVGARGAQEREARHITADLQAHRRHLAEHLASGGDPQRGQAEPAAVTDAYLSALGGEPEQERDGGELRPTLPQTGAARAASPSRRRGGDVDSMVAAAGWLGAVLGVDLGLDDDEDEIGDEGGRAS